MEGLIGVIVVWLSGYALVAGLGWLIERKKER